MPKGKNNQRVNTLAGSFFNIFLLKKRYFKKNNKRTFGALKMFTWCKKIASKTNAMNVDVLINKILLAKNANDIFDIQNYKSQYFEYLKTIHPDICPHPFANKAVSQLNTFKVEIENSKKIVDDAGTIEQVNNHTLQFFGDKDLLNTSINNYKQLKTLTDPASQHFKKYLPTSLELKNNTLLLSFPYKLIPLYKLNLPQHHVTWIGSRMFEFIAWLHQINRVHAGINPASIAVVPETHGIVCLSFYHLLPLGNKLKSVSAGYLNWYPSLTFDKKIAVPTIDISLVQRTALYLLGDTSGNGVKLKSIYNQQLIDFLITFHYNTFTTFDNYRKLLHTEFGKPTFHPLNL